MKTGGPKRTLKRGHCSNRDYFVCVFYSFKESPFSFQSYTIYFCFIYNFIYFSKSLVNKKVDLRSLRGGGGAAIDKQYSDRQFRERSCSIENCPLTYNFLAFLSVHLRELFNLCALKTGINNEIVARGSVRKMNQNLKDEYTRKFDIIVGSWFKDSRVSIWLTFHVWRYKKTLWTLKVKISAVWRFTVKFQWLLLQRLHGENSIDELEYL